MDKKSPAPKRRAPQKRAAQPAERQPAAPKAKARAPKRAQSKAKGSKAKGSKAKARMRAAKYAVGQVVKHRIYPFRGVIFDIDPVFANTEEWWQAIPEEIRPRKDQPFYHLLAENAETEYIAYVSEQNLLPDDTQEPLRHPQIGELFAEDGNGNYRARFLQPH